MRRITFLKALAGLTGLTVGRLTEKFGAFNDQVKVPEPVKAATLDQSMRYYSPRNNTILLMNAAEPLEAGDVVYLNSNAELCKLKDNVDLRGRRSFEPFGIAIEHIPHGKPGMVRMGTDDRD